MLCLDNPVKRPLFPLADDEDLKTPAISMELSWHNGNGMDAPIRPRNGPYLNYLSCSMTGCCCART